MMATLQEVLLQKSLDKTLPEKVAESELQEARQRLDDDKNDIEVIEAWHTSRIHALVTQLQLPVMSRESKIDFCDKNDADEVAQTIWRIVEEKPSLVDAWYQSKTGLNNLRFDRNIVTKYRASQGTKVPYSVYGDIMEMKFHFGSAGVESRLTHKAMAGRRAYTINVNTALALLRPQLPSKLVEIVKQFVPDYIDHLKQEKLRLEKAPRW